MAPAWSPPAPATPLRPSPPRGPPGRVRSPAPSCVPRLLVPADTVRRRPAVVGVFSSFPLASGEQREEVEEVAWGPPPAPSWRCAGDAGAPVAFQGEKLLLL